MWMPQTFHRRTHVRAVENRVPLKPSKHVYGAHMRLSMLANAPLRKVISSETRRVRSLGVVHQQKYSMSVSESYLARVFEKPPV